MEKIKLWCILIKNLDKGSEWGILCEPRFDYWGESEEYVAGSFSWDVSPGVDGGGACAYSKTLMECLRCCNPFWHRRWEGYVDVPCPIWLAKLLFLKKTLRDNKLPYERDHRIKMESPLLSGRVIDR